LDNPHTNHNYNGISIIICTYNGEKTLPLTLRSIAKLELPKNIPTELILVNNNSSDNTSEIVLNEWNLYDSCISFKLVNELNPGKMNAVFTGVYSASYDLIVFCDDDNLLYRDYLLKALDIMSNNNDVGALGGQGFAISDVELPNWFHEVSNSYACGRQRNRSGYCTDRRYLWGAGMVSSKKLLKKVMSTPMKCLGRNGNELSSGEDTEICLKIILLGKELYFCEDLKYDHFIEARRLSLDYFNKMREGFVMASINNYSYEFEIQKLMNPGVKFYWACIKDLILILMIKFKIIKPLERKLFNIFFLYKKGFF